MNMIRERVLTDGGFSPVPSDDSHRIETNEMRIVKLEAACNSLTAELRKRDAHWEGVRNTDLVKAVDTVEAQTRELNVLRKEHDRACKKVKDLEAELFKVKEELLLAREVEQPVKKSK